MFLCLFVCVCVCVCVCVRACACVLVGVCMLVRAHTRACVFMYYMFFANEVFIDVENVFLQTRISC